MPRLRVQATNSPVRRSDLGGHGGAIRIRAGPHTLNVPKQQVCSEPEVSLRATSIAGDRGGCKQPIERCPSPAFWQSRSEQNIADVCGAARPSASASQKTCHFNRRVCLLDEGARRLCTRCGLRREFGKFPDMFRKRSGRRRTCLDDARDNLECAGRLGEKPA